VIKFNHTQMYFFVLVLPKTFEKGYEKE